MTDPVGGPAVTLDGALLELKHEMQDFMLGTANGGDVSDLLERLVSLQSNISDVYDAVEKSATFKGWLSVDEDPPPSTS